MQAFFRRYYHPANASIALAGDIEPAAALALVERYFGEIDAGEPVGPIHVDAALPRDVRIYFEDRVELPRLYLAWLTPAMFAEGDADLDLATDLLANGKTSRLYRRLVFDERLATDVSASQNSREMMGYAQITATAAPGHTLAELEAVIFEEIARLAAEGPTDDEIERGRVQAEAQFMFRLQTVGGFGGKSDQLNAYNVFLDDPAYFAKDLQRYQVCSKASLQAVVNRYLDRTRRVTLSIVPHGRAALAAPDPSWRSSLDPAARIGETAGRRAHRHPRVDRSRLPATGPARPFPFPAIDKSTLPNGLRIWTVRHTQVPLVAFTLLIRRGASADPVGKEGLAAITADMLDEGSGDRSAIEMHEALARLGAQFDTDIGSDATVASVTVLSRFADRALALLSDVVVRPAIREADFSRVRQLRLHRLTQMRDMPGAVADRAFLRLVYGAHPYGHSPIGTEASLAAMDVDDVRGFHTRAVRPNVRR